MIWAMTEESIATVEVTATDSPAGSQGGSLHADDPSILTRTDEQVTRSVRDPAHSFDAVHYKIQSYSLQLDRITQYAGEIGSRVSANDGEYPIAFVSINHVDIFPPKAPGNKIQNTESREARLEFSLCLVI
jgi:hypothetical protein